MQNQEKDSAQQNLEEQIKTLQEENEKLRKTDSKPVKQKPKSRSFWSAFLIIIATILVPVALISSWARTELVNEDAFVATFAPLADHPAVQEAVADASLQVVEQHFDIDQMTNDLFDGFAELGLPSKASSALTLLRTPVANGARSLIHNSVNQFISSDLFADSWRTTLAHSHRALVATATIENDPSGTLLVDSSGDVRIQLEPVLTAVTGYLSESGFPAIKNIPGANASIVVAHSDSLAMLGLVYNLTTMLGWWIPVITFLLFGLGILISFNRRAALIGSAIGLTISSAFFLILLSVGSVATSLSIAQSGVSNHAISAIYAQLTLRMQNTARDLLIIGILLIIIAVATGNRAFREFMNRVNPALREAANLTDKSAPELQHFLGKYRVATRTALVLISGLLVILFPINALGIILLFLVALIIWGVLVVLEAPKDTSR